MMAASRETYVPKVSGSYLFNKVGSPNQLPPSDIRSTCPDVGIDGLSYSSKEPYNSQREDHGQFDMLGPQLIDQQRPKMNRFLATAHPKSISSHPDHYMYPSFKLRSPDFVASQPPSQPSYGGARQQQGLAPRDISTRQQFRQSQTKRSAPLDSRRSSQLSPPAPSGSVAHGNRHMASFPMPLPPHPAANYLPFLEPVPSSASKAPPTTPETASENLQNGYSTQISFHNPQVAEAAQVSSHVRWN